jgi:hypothetical protein
MHLARLRAPVTDKAKGNTRIVAWFSSQKDAAARGHWQIGARHRGRRGRRESDHHGPLADSKSAREHPVFSGG